MVPRRQSKEIARPVWLKGVALAKFAMNYMHFVKETDHFARLYGFISYRRNNFRRTKIQKQRNCEHTDKKETLHPESNALNLV